MNTVRYIFGLDMSMMVNAIASDMTDYDRRSPELCF